MFSKEYQITDAVFVNQNKNTYFFKDRFVYKFNISTNKGRISKSN